MADAQRRLDPSSLKWHQDGELSSQDLFNLVCRLGQKYPKPAHL